MLLNFVKINPSGNSTVYILDPIPREYYQEIAQKLLRSDNIYCEQVGFLEKGDNGQKVYRLYMAGGEFCGNAARGLAVWLSYRYYPYAYSNEKGQTIVPLEVSGIDGVLQVEVTDLNLPQKKFARIAMPIPSAIKEFDLGDGIGRFYAVDLKGIVHAILKDQKPDLDKFYLVKKKLQEEMGPLEAVGAMFYNEREQVLTPLVNVCNLDSLVWESSCGSGSISVGCVQAMLEGKSIEGLTLRQPGGSLAVDILWDQGIKAAYLSGEISIVAEGTLFVEVSNH